MDAILSASRIKDQATKDLVYYLLKRDKEKEQRIAELERKLQPTNVVGFHQNPGTTTLEIAFPNRSFKGGD